jgi:hypothetical protein
MLETMKHAVIGSGPCGALAAYLLLRAGQDVWLYDVNSDETLNPLDLISKLKLLGESSAPYDIQQILRVVHHQSPLGIYRSKLSGGFSNIWGATWGAQSSLNTDTWHRHHEVVTDILIEDGYLGDNSNLNCDCLQFLDDLSHSSDLSPGFALEKSLLALNPCVCGCVPNGQSSCVHGGVWNSKSLLAKCDSFDGFKFKFGHDVMRIEKSLAGLKLIGTGFSDEFQSVTVAAGSLGTVEILLNSLKDVRALTLKDTRMAFLPLFKFGIRTRHKGGFAFSQYNINTNFGKQNLAVHIQLYSDAEIYRHRIVGKVPGFLSHLIEPFLNVILPHLAIAIVYVDAEMSTQISFSKTNQSRELNVDFIKASVSGRGLKRRLWSIFREIKFLPLLPLLSWSKPGESYHLGALGNQILDDFGSVKELPGVYIAGAIALPRVEPGPITHSAMAQTSRLIEHLTTKT